jgi:hypothetical protein
VSFFYKSRDYSKLEKPTARGLSFSGMFSVGTANAGWTDIDNFVSRTKALYFQCGVARRCLEIRVEKLASIKIKVDGSKRAKLVLSKPNFRDRTLSNFLRVAEMDLSIGGDHWVWLNRDLRERPIMEGLRYDFVIQEPTTSTIFYDPGYGVSKVSDPELIFHMDPADFGRTLSVERRVAKGIYESVDGAILQISIPNPLSASDGSGAGDAILRDIAALNAATKLMHSRFANGGRKAGWITLPEIDGFDDMTDDDWSKVRETMAKLRDDDELKGLVAGSQFIENQLDFKELDIVAVCEALERRIAMGLAVQPVMLGFAGETTGMNMRTADRTFYTGWLKPRADFVLGQLEAFLQDELNEPKLTITIDETQLPYLQDDKLEKVDKMAGRGALTFNEYRAEMGFAPVAWGDVQIPVAGAGEAVSGGDEAPEPKPNRKKPVQVSHDADTSGRADQRR